MLTNRPKIPDIHKRDISQLHFTQNDEKYDKSDPVQISALFGTI